MKINLLLLNDLLPKSMNIFGGYDYKFSSKPTHQPVMIAKQLYEREIV